VCRTGGMSAAFGSEDQMINIETWRAVYILRGHTGGQCVDYKSLLCVQLQQHRVLQSMAVIFSSFNNG